MLKKILYSLLALILLAAALFAGLLFAPKDTHSQRLRVERGLDDATVSPARSDFDTKRLPENELSEFLQRSHFQVAFFMYSK